MAETDSNSLKAMRDKGAVINANAEQDPDLLKNLAGYQKTLSVSTFLCPENGSTPIFMVYCPTVDGGQCHHMPPNVDSVG